jgi:hypothetical protein
MILGGVLDVLSGARLVLAALRRRRGEAPVAPAEPGQLLRHEEITKDVPDGATGWRILYTTTRDEVEAALASALVVVPDAAEGPVPVIAWAHGTTGVARRCGPDDHAQRAGGRRLPPHRPGPRLGRPRHGGGGSADGLM